MLPGWCFEMFISVEDGWDEEIVEPPANGFTTDDDPQ